MLLCLPLRMWINTLTFSFVWKQRKHFVMLESTNIFTGEKLYQLKKNIFWKEFMWNYFCDLKDPPLEPFKSLTLPNWPLQEGRFLGFEGIQIWQDSKFQRNFSEIEVAIFGHIFASYVCRDFYKNSIFIPNRAFSEVRRFSHLRVAFINFRV